MTTNAMTETGPSLARWFHAATSYPPSSGIRDARVGQAACGPALLLPRPRALTGSLDEAIAGRASCRRFAPATLDLADISTLLHISYGTNGEAAVAGFRFEVRPVPSAGATYPLSIRLIAWTVGGATPGIYRYLPDRHALERRPGHVTPAVAREIFLGQEHILPAAALAVVTARLDAPLARYGDRGYRYVVLEAGHVVQNLNLASSAMGLGALDLGGFRDQELTDSLGLAGEVPIYAVALGHPAGPDGRHLREPATGQLRESPNTA